MTIARRDKKTQFGAGFSAVASIFLLLMLIKNSSLAYREVIFALKMCGEMLIPSLFPLMVASEIATQTGALEKIGKHLLLPLGHIFGVNTAAIVPFLLGIVGGYTTSCTSAVHLLEVGKISKSDCESIIALSSMPSLAFLCNFVGGSLFQNSTIGWALWGITVLSSLICGIINKIFFSQKKIDIQNYESPHLAKKSFSSISIHAIVHSAGAMLTICASVVFFSVLIEVLGFVLTDLKIPQMFGESMLGLLEITHAVNFASSFSENKIALALAAFYVGWSGFSVHFQIIALCDGHGLSYKRYFIFKTLQAFLCLVMTFLFL